MSAFTWHRHEAKTGVHFATCSEYQALSPYRRVLFVGRPHMGTSSARNATCRGSRTHSKLKRYSPVMTFTHFGRTFRCYAVLRRCCPKGRPTTEKVLSQRGFLSPSTPSRGSVKHQHFSMLGASEKVVLDFVRRGISFRRNASVRRRACCRLQHPKVCGLFSI